MPSLQAVEAHSWPLSGPSPQDPAHPKLGQLQVHSRVSSELCLPQAAKYRQDLGIGFFTTPTNDPHLTIATAQHIQKLDTLDTQDEQGVSMMQRRKEGGGLRQQPMMKVCLKKGARSEILLSLMTSAR